MPVSWLGDSTDGEKLTEFAGRLCYMSQSNPAERTTHDYLKNIFKSAHGSVIEHANYSLLIQGVSRSLTHEWVRHRAGWAYSQLSQRFVDEKHVGFVIPPALLGPASDKESHIAMLKFRQACEEASEKYAALSDLLYTKFKDYPDKTMRRKKAREAARCVLPNATETKIVMTANVRAWRTVLGIRGDPHADAEINRLARACATLLKAETPNFFQDMTVTSDSVLFEYNKI